MTKIEEPIKQMEEAPKDGSSGALPEIDFLEEKDDRKVKKVDSETLSLNGDKYKIIENYREALDLEMFEGRYSEFLEKYDYIVGDLSDDNKSLRLRGFYEDKNKKVPIDMRIGSLEDYLLEFCNFGCAYFVLERLEPKKKSRSKNRNRNNKKNYYENKKEKNLKKFEQVKRKKERNKNRSQEKKNRKGFVKKERSASNQKETQEKENKVKTVKDQKGKKKFEIRRKKK